MKASFLVLLPLICSLLNACGGYPRLLSFPFDRGGRSLNSPAAESDAQIRGRFIVFVSDRNGSQSVYLFDAFSRRLLDLPGLNSLDQIAAHPSISEDGRYIVFRGTRQGNAGIYLYDRETQQKREIAPDLAAEVRNPSISADGSRIVFEIGKDGQWDLTVYARTGEKLF
ncbi:MAG: Tol-Pal system protein TolB [Chroococcopsis gigantea SAG 12.99]|nr:Tol-Pal system protein TolB [Chroococcopsis gigantea SAG 12.99]